MRRPLTGAILGYIIGLAIAVVLQRQGVWPLDQLTFFLLPAIAGLVGLALLSIGRRGSRGTLIIALLILIPIAAWGALGFGEINAKGELNGGCTVDAFSDVDETTVTDTSKQDPFVIDPDGGLSWVAMSPTVFDDYPWEINVQIGGIAITLDSEESQDNDGGSQINGDDIGNIRQYSDDRGINIDLLVGIHEVSGFASTCDGFGFVKILSDGLGTVELVALAIAIILLVILIILTVSGRVRSVEVQSATVSGDVDLDEIDIDDLKANPGAENLPDRDDLA